MIEIQRLEVELRLKSRAAVRSTLAHGSQVEFKAADSGSRADDATTTSRWKCLEVIPTPHRSRWYGKWSQCNYLMNCRLSTAPFLQFFTLKRAQSKRGKSEFFTQKVPKKVVKTGDPADTDIAPESSKREGYFSRPPKIKFQNTGKHTDVCHTHILLGKISKNPGRAGGTDKLILHTRT